LRRTSAITAVGLTLAQVDRSGALGKFEIPEPTRSGVPSRCEKYCRNGGMAFSHHHGVGFTGSTMAIMAPSGGPLK
jgi:hypothetical protein